MPFAVLVLNVVQPNAIEGSYGNIPLKLMQTTAYHNRAPHENTWHAYKDHIGLMCECSVNFYPLQAFLNNRLEPNTFRCFGVRATMFVFFLMFPYRKLMLLTLRIANESIWFKAII